MVQAGAVSIDGKKLSCKHCDATRFEVTNYRLGLFGRAAVAVVCASCHFVHTFSKSALVRVLV